MPCILPAHWPEVGPQCPGPFWNLPPQGKVPPSSPPRARSSRPQTRLKSSAWKNNGKYVQSIKRLGKFNC